MKEEYILRFAKIILVSSDKEDYQRLKAYGFQKIAWFKSPRAAFVFFESQPKMIKEYSVFFERYTRGMDCAPLRHLLWENKEQMVRVELYSQRVQDYKDKEECIKKKRMFDVNVYLFKNALELNEKCIIENKKYTNIEFAKICDLVMLRLKNRVLPLRTEDFRILYITGVTNTNKVLFEKEMNNRGIVVNCVEWHEDNIPLSDYDIVVLQDDFVLKNRPDIKENSVFYSCFSSVPFSTSLENYSLSYILGESIALTCKKGVEEEKTIYSFCFSNEFERMASTFMVAIETVSKMMQVISPKNCISSLQYIKEHSKQVHAFLEEEKQWLAPIEEFNQFVALLENYFSCFADLYMKKDMYGIEVMKDENFYIIQNFYKGRVNGIIRIPLEQEEFLKCFDVQFVNLKGSLRDFESFGIYLEKLVKKENVPKIPDEKAYAMY